MSTSQKLNALQKQRLLELMSNRPLLRAGKFTSTFTHKLAQEQWEQISTILNSIPGAHKEWRAWRKTWQDILSKTKQKSAAINKIKRGTGGGPPPPTLDQYEEEVSILLHPNAVAGHSNSTESVVIFDDFITVADVNVEESMMIPLPQVNDTDNLIAPPPEPAQSAVPISDNLIAPPPEPAQSAVPISDNLIAPPPAFARPAVPQTKNNKKVKTNLKSLLKEKVKIKKELLQEKKKWYEGCLALMERHNQVLEEIVRNQTRALQDLSNILQNKNND